MCPASDFAFVQDGGAIGEQTRRMDSPSSPSEPRVAGVTDWPRPRPGAKVSDEQFIDDSARRPRGRLAEEGYGGPAGAPPGHEEVFDALLSRVGPVGDERALDVGCGGGRLIERLLDGGAAQVAGIDHSSDVLALARRRNQTALARGIVTLELGDAAALPWRDGTFTLVLSSNAFFFFPSPLDVLAEMHRVLVPGGRLAVATVPGPEAPDCIWGPAMRVYSDVELRALHQRAGFEQITVQTDQRLQLALARKEQP